MDVLRGARANVRLLSLANGSPVIAKLILGETFSWPVDGNIRFIDRRPLFVVVVVNSIKRLTLAGRLEKRTSELVIIAEPQIPRGL